MHATSETALKTSTKESQLLEHLSNCQSSVAFPWSFTFPFQDSLLLFGFTISSFFSACEFSTGHCSSFLEWQVGMMELALQLECGLLLLRNCIILDGLKFRNNRNSFKWLRFWLLCKIASNTFPYVGLCINLLLLGFNAVQILSFNKRIPFTAVGEKRAYGSCCCMAWQRPWTRPINFSEIHFQVNIRTAGLVISAECSWTSKIRNN